MGMNLNPYLSFDGTARAAMEFYRDVLGGDLSVMTFAEMGMEGASAEGVMHAQLATPDGFLLMASDTPPGMAHVPHHAQVSLTGDDDALRGYWEKLSADSEVTQPLEKQVWGDEFGSCVDRFGVTWLVNIAAPRG